MSRTWGNTYTHNPQHTEREEPADTLTDVILAAVMVLIAVAILTVVAVNRHNAEQSILEDVPVDVGTPAVVERGWE